MRETHRKRYAYGCVLGLILSLGLTTEAGGASRKNVAREEGGVQPSVDVRVHNYAQVLGDTLIRAEREAGEIYHAAGVEISWTNCNPLESDVPQDSNCAALINPARLDVRLLPDIGTVGGTTRRTMGIAVGYLASVSLRRVRQDADEFGVTLDAVLGPTLAHEIGHLLLTSQGHSPNGIMRARWRREDYERAPRGAFAFTLKQAEMIRSEARKRAQWQAASSPLSSSLEKAHSAE